MAVEETLDTGGIYSSIEIPIGSHETLKDLQTKCITEGTALLLQSLKEGLGDLFSKLVNLPTLISLRMRNLK